MNNKVKQMDRSKRPSTLTRRFWPSPGLIRGGNLNPAPAVQGVKETGTEQNASASTAADPAESTEFHPFAEIFPMLDDEQLHGLAQDIAAHGLLDPIIMYERKILDGRCRYRAGRIAGVAPRFEDYVGNDPLGYVVSHNLHRRHLTESQRAMVAARLADLQLGANQHTQGVPIGRAADLLNVGERSVARAKEVVRDGTPELVKAVETGEIAVSAAAEIRATRRRRSTRSWPTQNKEAPRAKTIQGLGSAGAVTAACLPPGVNRRPASRR